MTIAFFVDGGKKLGLGHIRRTQSIANELSLLGENSIFLVDNIQAKKFLEKKFKTFQIPTSKNGFQKIENILSAENCSTIIIDGKKLSTLSTLTKLKHFHTVLIDNLKFYNLADLVILPGIEEQFPFIPKNSYTGTKYVVLGPEFISKKIRKDNSIIITCGSVDKENITGKLIKEFKNDVRNFKVKIILGEFYSHKQMIQKLILNDSRFIIVNSPSSMFEYLSQSTLGIISFGVTLYEAAALKLPTFVISHNEENHNSAKAVCKRLNSQYLGKYDSIDYAQVSKKAIDFLNNNKKFPKTKNLPKIDNNGAKRIAKLIVYFIQKFRHPG